MQSVLSRWLSFIGTSRKGSVWSRGKKVVRFLPLSRCATLSPQPGGAFVTQLNAAAPIRHHIARPPLQQLSVALRQASRSQSP